jgi:molecular chaperone GrpE
MSTEGPSSPEEEGYGPGPDLPEGTAASSQADELAAEQRAVEGLATGQEVDLAELTRQRDDYLDTLRRLQAEFDNYRRRIERQRSEGVEQAATSLVKALLPVLDTADLALAHGGGEDIRQLAGALFDVLAKEGLQRIDPEGEPFDPEHHDAVAHEAAGDEAPELPQVAEVLRAGYRWKGRVLRPAMVKVRS